MTSAYMLKNLSSPTDAWDDDTDLDRELSWRKHKAPLTHNLQTAGHGFHVLFGTAGTGKTTALARPAWPSRADADIIISTHRLSKDEMINLINHLRGWFIPSREMGGAAPCSIEVAEAKYFGKAKWFSHLQPLDLKAGEEQFRQQLFCSFEQDPIEDGYWHPAEQIIEDALKRYKSGSIDWISAIYHEHTDSPTMAVNILRCLSRLDYSLVRPWGVEMACKALSNPNIEIRDAALCAFEIWGGEESVVILKNHLKAEADPWLKDYTRRVIRDLSAELR